MCFSAAGLCLDSTAVRSSLSFGLLLALAPACAAPQEEARPALHPLPEGWLDVEPLAFERLLEEELAPNDPLLWNPAALEELAAALERQDQGSVRAALLLSRSRHESAARTILARLEERIVGPERQSDAGDVVAAAALARILGPGMFPRRIDALAYGRRAHPDLEVRVECACTALALGSDASIPFLLQVLRIDTWAGEHDERDFESSPNTAWARGRAAEALSLRAGIPVAYRTDASIADRERETDRLQRILLGGL